MKNSETGGYDVAHGELIAKRMLDEPDVSKVNKFEFTIRSSSGSVKQTYTLYVYTVTKTQMSSQFHLIRLNLQPVPQQM